MYIVTINIIITYYKPIRRIGNKYFHLFSFSFVNRKNISFKKSYFYEAGQDLARFSSRRILRLHSSLHSMTVDLSVIINPSLELASFSIPSIK